jgi:hypothetical protein
VLIYTSHITPRVLYTCEALFFGEGEITDSKEKFLAHTGAKINYSDDRFCDALWIIPCGLLAEINIHEQKIVCAEWEGMKTFFVTPGDIPFDVFSASFYLLSRYEEYLPYEPDQYGRYWHENCVAYKEGFLHLPLVDLWMKKLAEKVPGFGFRVSGFRFVPTYDIDIAYSYLHHSIARNVFGFYRDMLQGKFEAVAERANVYSGRKPDPFDVYDWLDGLHEQYHLQPMYFFLLAEKRKDKDKNINPHTKGMQQLIKRHAGKYITGIHPSWQSGEDDNILAREINILKETGGKQVLLSRQHYIKMMLPQTYRTLMNAGITDDYSMGYGTINGFRSSYAQPYAWFDLERNTVTSLTIHPFCYMDATAVFQLRETEEEAATELQEYFDVVRSVNGELITIFHNDFLTEQPEWIGWRKMYAAFLEKNFSVT